MMLPVRQEQLYDLIAAWATAGTKATGHLHDSSALLNGGAAAPAGTAP